jgi:hypothetical protein
MIRLEAFSRDATHRGPAVLYIARPRRGLHGFEDCEIW